MAFGTVRLTGPNVWGPPPDPEASRQLLRRVVDVGVNLIDTASSYGPEIAEKLIAEALHPYPDDLVIATKGGLAPTGPGNFDRDGRPESLRRSCEGSLRRLRLDCIDVYQLHAVDPRVPLEESVGGLVELKEGGLIRHIGLSNVTVDQLAQARAIVPIVSVQNCYNVVDRLYDAVVVECEHSDTAFLPWFPLARGELARSSVLDQLARQMGATRAQIALAWLLHRSPVIVPIPGTNDMKHFESNHAARNIELSDADLRQLDLINERTSPLIDDPSR
jgi:pyridoxine 4-dehydrogenase